MPGSGDTKINKSLCSPGCYHLKEVLSAHFKIMVISLGTYTVPHIHTQKHTHILKDLGVCQKFSGTERSRQALRAKAHI